MAYNVVEFCQCFREPTKSIFQVEVAISSENEVDKSVPGYTPPQVYSHGRKAFKSPSPVY